MVGSELTVALTAADSSAPPVLCGVQIVAQGR